MLLTTEEPSRYKTLRPAFARVMPVFSQKAAADAARADLGHALGGLAAVLDGGRLPAGAAHAADLLLGACRLVCAAPHLAAPPPEARAYAAVSPAAASAGRLIEIARAGHFRARSVSLSGHWWRQDQGALVAFCNDGSPVALIPASPGRYEMIDPADGTRRRLTLTLARAMQPEAFSFTRPLPARRLSGSDLLWFDLSNSRRDLWAILFAALVSGALSLAMPLAIGMVAQNLIPESARGQLLVVGAGLVVAVLASAAFRAVGTVAALRIEGKMAQAALAGIWDRLLRLPAPFFRSRPAGDLALRATSLLQTYRLAATSIGSCAFTVVPALANLWLMFFLAWKLAILATAIVCMIACTAAVVCWLEWRARTAILDLEGTLTSQLLETLTGIAKLKAAGAEIPAFTRWALSFAALKRAAFSARRISTFFGVFASAAPTAATLVVFASFEGLTASSDLTLGTFVSFNMALGIVVSAALSVSLAAIKLTRGLPAAARILPVLGAVPESGASAGSAPELTGNIELSHVSFRYDPDGPRALDDVSLSIRPGEFVAVVGPSGSGKSTLLRLLLGLDQQESGSVCFDGREVRTLDLSGLRRQIGTVVQNGRLFAGSILENIAGSRLLSAEEAWELVERVGLAAELRNMPMGIHTYLNDGASSLSGGQRQQLMLARAIAANPRVLLLDEATSALDNVTQMRVTRSIEQMHVTRIVVAHRLNSVRHADRIVVMNAGRIVATGTFEELSARSELFADLISRQLL